MSTKYSAATACGWFVHTIVPIYKTTAVILLLLAGSEKFNAPDKSLSLFVFLFFSLCFSDLLQLLHIKDTQLQGTKYKGPDLQYENIWNVWLN